MSSKARCPSCLRVDGVQALARQDGDTYLCAFCGLSWRTFVGSDCARVNGAIRSAALTLDSVSHLSCCPSRVLEALALLRSEILVRLRPTGDC